MKILRDTDWKLLGFKEHCDVLDNKPAFLFQHRKFFDVLVLNEAKYVDVANNIVYFLNVKDKEKVRVSAQTRKRVSELPVLDLAKLCEARD